MMISYYADSRQHGRYLFSMMKKYSVACGDFIYVSFLQLNKNKEPIKMHK